MRSLRLNCIDCGDGNAGSAVYLQQGPPESLDALSTRFPEETLIDPFTGKRFSYRPTGDTFLLYSAGPNLTDDGGRHDFNNGDIVWRGTWSK